MSLDFQLTVFTDPQGEAAAKIYVVAVPTRDVTDDELAAYRLTGTIVGPTCKYSSTLQTKIPFRHRGFTQCGHRTALVAEAIVPDPCYWSPELPFLYRAVGEVSGAITGAFAFEQLFGVRSLGTSRNRFTLNGKVWVPRGVHRGIALNATLDDWRAASTVMIVDEPTAALCREASEVGVLLASFVAPMHGTELATWLRIGSYPCLTLAAFVYEPHNRRELQTAARNILFGQSIGGSATFAEGSRFNVFPFLAEESWGTSRETEHLRRIAKDTSARVLNTGLPAVALRQLNETRSLAELRAECDRFQSELAASQIDVAGYMIG